MIVNGKLIANITCPNCRFRHPAGDCAYWAAYVKAEKSARMFGDTFFANWPHVQPDDAVEWVKANPEVAAELLQRLRLDVGRLSDQLAAISWELNPDRMGK